MCTGLYSVTKCPYCMWDWGPANVWWQFQLTALLKATITSSQTLNNETCKAYLRQLCTPAPTDNKDKPTEHSNELTVSLLFGHTTCTYAYAESDGKIDRDWSWLVLRTGDAVTLYRSHVNNVPWKCLNAFVYGFCLSTRLNASPGCWQSEYIINA